MPSIYLQVAVNEDIDLRSIAKLKHGANTIKRLRRWERRVSRAMGFWQSYCHLVWGTKHREPLIVGDREEIIRRAIAVKSREFETLIHAIGFMPEHIHLVVSIPPKVAPAEFVHGAKGLASRDVNRDSTEGLGYFSWQKEYGQISFGERSLEDIVRYVENQRRHHYENQLWPLFERLEPFPAR